MRKRRVSGREVIKTLIQHFAFEVVGQKGSHVKLRTFVDGKKLTTIVPDHKELDYGTLRGILRLAHVDEENFWEVS